MGHGHMACSKANVCWSQISSLPQVNVPQILIGSILNFGTGGVSIGGKGSKAKTLESEYQLFRTYTSRLCFLSDVDPFPEILGPNDWEGMSLLWHIAPILLMVTPTARPVISKSRPNLWYISLYQAASPKGSEMQDRLICQDRC